MGVMSQPTADDPTVSRELERLPSEVWEQLTSPDGFEHWMGPGSTIDPEPGGELIAADPESGVPRIGRMLDVEPGRRLHWVWRPLGDDPDGDGSTEVIVELEPTEEPVPTTIITVTERPSTLTVDPAGIRASAAMAAVCSR